MMYTYMFIILWHGVLPGYWLAFLFEIPVITAEKQVGSVFGNKDLFLRLNLAAVWNWSISIGFTFKDLRVQSSITNRRTIPTARQSDLTLLWSV